MIDFYHCYGNESEGAKFWLQVLTDLQNCGVEDILIASVDGLKGFPEAINSVFPGTEVQLCIVHRQFRTLTKTKGAFPNDNSLLKLLYAGIQNAEKKWTMPIRNWSLTISQLNIHFKERLKDALNLV